jgi:outer membrane protein assembly factor BamD
MNYLVNSLASHEIHVARYYMQRNAYVAAANRAQYALKNYPQAPANEEGLLILVQASDKLGMTDLRNDAGRWSFRAAAISCPARNLSIQFRAAAE